MISSGVTAGLIEFGPVEAGAFVGMADGPLQALELVGGQFVHGLETGYEGSGHARFLQSDIGETGGAQAGGGRVVAGGGAQKGRPQFGVHQELLAGALADDAAVGQQTGGGRRRQSPGRVLFHQRMVTPNGKARG